MGISKHRSSKEMEVFDTFCKARWPAGFVCPRCKSKDAKRLERRLSYQCNKCRYQCRILSGTRLEGTRLPLARIFEAIKSFVENRTEERSNPGHWKGGGTQGRKLRWIQTGEPEFLGYSGKITVRELLGDKGLGTKSFGTAHRFQRKVLKLCATQQVFREEVDHAKCLRQLLTILMAPKPPTS
jgi:ribosomal protein L37AE/L43A